MAATKGWMQGNPFSPRPGQPSKKKPLPEGFEEAFGERPKWRSFYQGQGKFRISYPEFKVLLGQWETELRAFRGFGFPPGVTEDLFASSAEVFAFWGLGVAQFHESRYGWAARFPESLLPHRDFGAELAVDFPHLVVSNYQIHVRMETGVELSPRHPFVHGGWSGIDDDDATG